MRCVLRTTSYEEIHNIRTAIVQNSAARSAPTRGATALDAYQSVERDQGSESSLHYRPAGGARPAAFSQDSDLSETFLKKSKTATGKSGRRKCATFWRFVTSD